VWVHHGYNLFFKIGIIYMKIWHKLLLWWLLLLFFFFDVRAIKAFSALQPNFSKITVQPKLIILLDYCSVFFLFFHTYYYMSTANLIWKFCKTACQLSFHTFGFFFALFVVKVKLTSSHWHKCSWIDFPREKSFGGDIGVFLHVYFFSAVYQPQF